MDAEITMCGSKFSVTFYCDSHLYQLFPRVRACVRGARKQGWAIWPLNDIAIFFCYIAIHYIYLDILTFHLKHLKMLDLTL